MNIIKRLLTKLENKKRALNKKNEQVSVGLSSKRELKWPRAEDIYSDVNESARNYVLFQSLSEDSRVRELTREPVESISRSSEGCGNDDDSHRRDYHHSDVSSSSCSSDDSSSSSCSSDSSSSDCSSSSSSDSGGCGCD